MDILGHFDHHEKKQDKEYFKYLIQVALSDGTVDPAELEMLHRFGRRKGFTDPEIDTLIGTIVQTTYTPPYELSKRFDQVYDLVKIVLADGVVNDNEMLFANRFAVKSGFSETEIPVLLNLLITGIKEGKDEEDLFELYKKGRKR